MHELALAGAVIDTAERHAAGRRVLLIVRLRLGELRQVVPDSLAFYFEHVARGTLCEGAVLEYEVVPASLGCRCERLRLSATWAQPRQRGQTPWRRGRRSAARSAARRMSRSRPGNEFEVESIEVEEPACTG